MLTPETRPAFKGLVEATRQAAERKFGPRHALFLILQLTHAGRFAKPGDERAPVIGQHNPVLDTRLGIPPDYPLITDEEIDRVQEYFIAAARLARQAGFDGVDLKACHGYLISELLASFNRPDSRYGGPFENRTRFLVETAQKIKEAEPGFVVTCRLNLFDALPFPFGFGVDPRDAETEDLSEPIELIKKLAGLGFPILSVTCGIPGFRAHYGRPYDKPLIGEDPPPEHSLVGISRWLRLAAGAQAACPELLVVGGGYSWLRQFFPAVAAAMVRSRKTSLIGLGREGLAYPNWASDLAEKGRLDPRRVCLTCSKCSEMLRAGSRVGCAVRDAEVYAGEYRQARKKARSGRRVSREKRHQKK
jgi:2,4-dienoyl-CoA reductase-like NADH-dependent reductase (Old Yellow Enzyme family)